MTAQSEAAPVARSKPAAFGSGIAIGTLGGLIGLIVVLLYLPIFELAENIK